MNYSKQRLWERFKKNYTKFSNIGQKSFKNEMLISYLITLKRILSLILQIAEIIVKIAKLLF